LYTLLVAIPPRWA